MEELLTLSINDFRGGITEEGRRGPRGSAKYVQGLDIRTGENVLKCQQALKKDTGSVVTDLVLAIVTASDGNKYAFGDTGKIYRKTGSTWSLVHTDADGRISGAVEYKSTTNTWIMYATQTKLKKISLANAGGTWAGNVIDAGTFLNGVAGDFHTMQAAIGVVIINDGDVLAMYDFNDAFNNAALRMVTGTKARCIRDRKNLVYIGDKNNVRKSGTLFDWDRLQDSWLDKEDAKGWGINAMEWFEGGALMQVGNNGQLKYFNLASISPYKRIPDTGLANPEAVCIHNEIVHIGMTGGTRDGVYAIGRLDNNDPISISLEYVPSHGKLTGCEIGAITSDGDDIYVSWKDGSTYGIDVTDHANKAEGVYESLRMNMSKPQIDKLVENIKTVILDMPEGTSIELFWRSSQDGYTTWKPAEMYDGATETDADNEDSDGSKIMWKLGAQGEEVEFRVLLHPSGNATPKILSLNAFFKFLGGL